MNSFISLSDELKNPSQELFNMISMVLKKHINKGNAYKLRSSTRLYKTFSDFNTFSDTYKSFMDFESIDILWNDWDELDKDDETQLIKYELIKLYMMVREFDKNVYQKFILSKMNINSTFISTYTIAKYLRMVTINNGYTCAIMYNNKTGDYRHYYGIRNNNWTMGSGQIKIFTGGFDEKLQYELCERVFDDLLYLINHNNCDEYHDIFKKCLHVREREFRENIIKDFCLLLHCDPYDEENIIKDYCLLLNCEL